MPYRDVLVECSQCGKRFIFTVEEQRRLATAGFDIVPPTMCPDCRGGSVAEVDEGDGPFEGVIKWYDPEKGYGFILA